MRDVELLAPWPASLPQLPHVVPLEQPVALLLRHAERPTIPSGQTGNSIGLTEQGARAAELLGHTLGHRILRLRTSPVRRCVETAEALRRDASATIEMVSDTSLGDPGVYVNDPALAWQNWEQWGHEGVIERLVAGSGMPGMNDPDRAARALSEHMVRESLGHPGLTVWVTHDIILIATVARLWGVTLDRSWWPAFLEAAALWREGERVVVSYRDRCEMVV